ncbi:UNVERIFIED_CONTAM: DEAD-box ATP-dependent RNA helicase 40 [Sesamum calycinum]|uniref:DEAD-box ATP-dependent RNA helicase 40 n=1 Tax=Sesamum calycinum TaxID=2727403 RepID=A0AAW2R884_9LAMI
MATAEPSTGTLGPRYAPDDPTLPEPWKGLIDGSTGLLYYWNPETNVTQYEKPAALRHLCHLGHACNVHTKLNPIPAGRAAESIQNLQNQQMMQSQLPQGQLLSSSLQQQTQVAPQATKQQVAPSAQLQGSQLGPTVHRVILRQSK